MNDEQLEQIFSELQDANCPSEMSDVLSPHSHDDLNAVYEDFLGQYGQGLAFGALERSEWLCGNLIINANQPSICFLRAVLDVVRRVIYDRQVDSAAEAATGHLN
jgi:hypothetical protein